MPSYRGKMFFSQGKNGWTEEFFVKGGTMQEAFPDLAALAEARAGLLGAGTELVCFELSRIHGWRFTLAGGVRTRPLPLLADEPFNGLLLQFQAGGIGDKPAYRRTWMLRGLPAGYKLAGPNPAAGTMAAVNNALTAFVRLLCNGRYFLQVADKETGWHPIRDIRPAALENMAIDGQPMPAANGQEGGTGLHLLFADHATLPAVDPETGDQSRLFLRDVRWSPPAAGRAAQLTGEKTVLATLPGLATVRSDVPKTGKFAGKGWASLRHMVYEPINRVVAIGPGERKCGRATLRQRLDARAVLPVTSAPPPPPPVTPLPPAASGDFSETTVIANAQDLIREIYRGYDPLPDGKINPVRIAPIQGEDNTYLVLCSGTDLGTNSATGIPQDIAAALALPSSFTAGLADAIVDATQPNAKLIVAGHSLGGMVLQNAIWWGIPRDRTVLTCVTFGSPVTMPGLQTVVYRYFVLPGDKVPQLSAFAWLFGDLQDFLYTPLDPGDIPPGPVNRHTRYRDCVDLQNWSPIGTPLTHPEIQTMTVGKWRSYPLPRLTI